jgi:CRP/FNR family transcriptional regulator, cyclic AMP receptor protein
LHTPYGLEIRDNCLQCSARFNRLFCDLSPESLQAFQAIKSTTVYPKGAVLFLEGQSPRGVYVLCSGRAKLTTSSSEGKTLIMRVADAGEVLGLSATVSGKPYDASAEVMDAAAQVNFVARDGFLRFLGQHGDACLRVAQHLSNNYHLACEQIRSLGLSHSVSERLAKLLLEWCDKAGEKSEEGIRVHMLLTHEQIAQLLGTSRETITRLLAEFKRSRFIKFRGPSLLIRNKAGLQSLTNG